MVVMGTKGRHSFMMMVMMPVVSMMAVRTMTAPSAAMVTVMARATHASASMPATAVSARSSAVHTHSLYNENMEFIIHSFQ